MKSLTFLLIVGLVIDYGQCYKYEDLRACPIKVKPVGCYSDHVSDNRQDNRALPNLIMNQRDTYSPVYDKNEPFLSWKEYDRFLPDFVCKCALKAFQKNYTLLGVQMYGECWSGIGDFRKYGKAGSCKSDKFRSSENSAKECKPATGTDSFNYVYEIMPSTCPQAFKPVGCFKDSMIRPRPLQHYLVKKHNYRDTTHKLTGKLDWRNWKTYVPDMICSCAAAAKEEGYDYFGIQFYSECWGAKEDDINLNRDGESVDCVDESWNSPCPCNSYTCVGK